MNLRDKLEKAAFVNPFTDVGFKLIFGREESKPVLTDKWGACTTDTVSKAFTVSS